MRILIVDADIASGIVWQVGLAPRGFSADIAGSLAEAEDFFSGASYDLMILELDLPDGDGLEWLRRSWQRVPTLVLTARECVQDCVAGLDAGADDYLIKPVHIEELAARLRALLRRQGPRRSAVLRAGTLTFDAANRRAFCRDAEIILTRREADLLEVLMRKDGAVVGREAIVDALYRYDESVTPNAIEAIVSRLRMKLRRACAHDVLLTVRGVGYLLIDADH